MQDLQHFGRHAVFFRTTLYASGLLLLSACGSSGVDTETDQNDLQLGAANPTPTVAITNPPAGSEAPSANQPTDEVQAVNLPPLIANTSYNCDPIVESVSFDTGETDQFTLSVTDESPLTLTYSVDISSSDTVSVNVAQNGVFTITALQSGESNVWLRAEDENGLADEYELKVIVN